MGRKSKKAGSGHLPLTNHEIQQYSKPYGTTTARLSGISQYPFGRCALSLHPAKDRPVATPSGGFIYERPAILEYLLTKTQDLKKQQALYEQQLQNSAAKQQQSSEQQKRKQEEEFENSQKVMAKKQKTDDINPLKRTSYWLAESQPELPDSSQQQQDSATAGAATLPSKTQPPPKRPPSPNSQQPLRRKDLIPLELKFNTKDQVLCAISEKPIVSQQALALITTKKNDDETNPAHVVLEQIYNDLEGKETIKQQQQQQQQQHRVCPITGRKLTKILLLHKGGSSFSGSGSIVEAKTYKPTMT